MGEYLLQQEQFAKNGSGAEGHNRQEAGIYKERSPFARALRSRMD